jgi:hypothetical protein
MVSKGGTNQYHGVVYDYIKNTVFNAHNFFDTATTKKAPLNFNQWGFTLGGPVIIPKLYNGRNKTFFFGSYEKLNQKAQSPGTSTVMTSAMRNGDFSALLDTSPTGCTPTPAGQAASAATGGICIKDPATQAKYPGNIIPASQLNTGAAQISKKYEAYVPLPNIAGLNNNLNNVYFPNNLFIAQTLERVDENIGERVRLFGRFHWQNLTYANGNQVPVSGGYGPANSRNYAFGYTQVITPNLVNDFHFGVNQFLTDSLNYWYVNGLKTAGTDLGIPGFNFDTTDNMPGIPNINVTNATGMNVGNNGTN